MTGLSRHAREGGMFPPLRRLRGFIAALFLTMVILSPFRASAQQPATTRSDEPGAIAGQIIRIVGQSEAPARREAAAVVLRLRTPDAIKALMDIFDANNNELAKIAVCEAISDTQAQIPEFIPKLQDLLQHKNSALRKAAATALGVYTDPNVAARLESFRQEQELLLLMESLDRLMDGLYDATTDETKRNALLLEWLKSPLALKRLKTLQIVNDALRAKGAKPANEILAQIRGTLTDPDDLVRQRAIAALRDIGLPEDATRIRALLASERSLVIREEIYKALGKLIDPASITACVGGLSEPDDRVGAAAADALGRLCQKGSGRDPETVTLVVNAILRRLTKPIDNVTLRRELVEAMADIADPRFSPLLVRHAKADELEPTIRQAAVRGLERVGDAAGLSIVLDRLTSDGDAGVREGAAQALGQLGDQQNHLQALRTRLDKGVEPASTVSSAAWDAYLLVFQKLSPEDQLLVIGSWERAEPERLIALGAVSKPAIRAVVAGKLLARLESLNAGDHAAAIAFLDQLAKVVPDLFGPEFGLRFNSIRNAHGPISTSTAPAATNPPSAAP